MNERVEKIFLMPTKNKLVILSLTIVGLLLIYYLLFYSLLGAQLSKLKTEVEGPQGLRSKVAREEQLAANLEIFRGEVRFLDIELNKALSELPDSKEVRQLLEKVSDKAISSGLEILKFAPETEVKRDFYAENPVSIEVKGTYHQIASFFDEIGRLERIVNLDKFQMNETKSDSNPQKGSSVDKENNLDPETGDVVLQAKVTATAFRFLEESERPKLNDKKSNRKRKNNSGAEANKV